MMAKRKSNTKKNLSRTQRDRIAGRIMNGWHACERGDTKAAHELLNKAYKEVMEMKTGWLERNPSTYDEGFRDGIEYGLEHCGVTKLVGRYKLKRALKKGRASEIKKQIAELETGRKAAQKEAAARIGKNPPHPESVNDMAKENPLPGWMLGRRGPALKKLLKRTSAPRGITANEANMHDIATLEAGDLIYGVGETQWLEGEQYSKRYMISKKGRAALKGKLARAKKRPAKKRAAKTAVKKKARRNPDRSKAIMSSFMRGV